MHPPPIGPGYGRPYSGRFWAALAAWFTADMLFLIPLLPGVGPAALVPWLGSGYGLFNVVLIGWVMATAMRWLWNPVMAPFPPVDPAEDAVRRACQSFSVGLMNLSLSMHVAVDLDYLHLNPASYLRACGARGASIPWDACEPSAPSLGGLHTVRLNANTITGPSWCLIPFKGRDQENA